MTVLHIARTHPDAVLPKRSLPGSAGFDIHSLDETVIPPRSQTVVPTGLVVQIPEDTYARIAPRSGLAMNHRIHVMAGVVDSTYRGEIKVILANMSDVDVCLPKGSRIAQLIIERIATDDFIEVPLDTLVQTQRGTGGFGSTGI